MQISLISSSWGILSAAKIIGMSFIQHCLHIGLNFNVHCQFLVGVGIFFYYIHTNFPLNKSWVLWSYVHLKQVVRRTWSNCLFLVSLVYSNASFQLHPRSGITLFVCLAVYPLAHLLVWPIFRRGNCLLYYSSMMLVILRCSKLKDAVCFTAVLFVARRFSVVIVPNVAYSSYQYEFLEFATKDFFFGLFHKIISWKNALIRFQCNQGK